MSDVEYRAVRCEPSGEFEMNGKKFMVWLYGTEFDFVIGWFEDGKSRFVICKDGHCDYACSGKPANR